MCPVEESEVSHASWSSGACGGARTSGFRDAEVLRTWSAEVWREGWRLADGCSATSHGWEGNLVGHARVLLCDMLRGHPEDRKRSLEPLTLRYSARGFGAVLSRSCLQTSLLPAQLPPMQFFSPRRVYTLGALPAVPATQARSCSVVELCQTEEKTLAGQLQARRGFMQVNLSGGEPCVLWTSPVRS